jgi:transcriptional regulator of heat shock response
VLREFTEEAPRVDTALYALLERRAWNDLLGEIADELGVLGVARDSHGEVAKEGLECLVENFPWERREDVEQVIRDFVELDQRIEDVVRHWEGAPLQVFIGRRSPLTRSEGLAVVMGRCRAQGNDVVVCTIGPKRMDYRRAIHMMRSIGVEDER